MEPVALGNLNGCMTIYTDAYIPSYNPSMQSRALSVRVQTSLPSMPIKRDGDTTVNHAKKAENSVSKNVPPQTHPNYGPSTESVRTRDFLERVGTKGLENYGVLIE